MNHGKASIDKEARYELRSQFQQQAGDQEIDNS